MRRYRLESAVDADPGRHCWSACQWNGRSRRSAERRGIGATRSLGTDAQPALQWAPCTYRPGHAPGKVLGPARPGPCRLPGQRHWPAYACARARRDRALPPVSITDGPRGVPCCRRAGCPNAVVPPPPPPLAGMVGMPSEVHTIEYLKAQLNMYARIQATSDDAGTAPRDRPDLGPARPPPPPWPSIAHATPPSTGRTAR